MNRLSPIEARRLWYSLPGDDDQRIVAFANAIADRLHRGPRPRQRIALDALDLGMLWYGALRRAGYEYVDEIAPLTYADLKTIKHIGHHGAMTIMAKVRRVLYPPAHACP
jgi:DNA-directed RNA polymerase alpha subunit